MNAAVERGELIGVVAGQPRIDADDAAAILLESEVLIFEAVQRGSEQSRGGKRTSESAAWKTTSVLRGSEPVRMVERLAPRRASMGSTRVASRRELFRTLFR